MIDFFNDYACEMGRKQKVKKNAKEIIDRLKDEENSISVRYSPRSHQDGTVGERVSEGYRAFRNKSMCNGTASADARPSVGSVWHYARL